MIIELTYLTPSKPHKIVAAEPAPCKALSPVTGFVKIATYK